MTRIHLWVEKSPQTTNRCFDMYLFLFHCVNFFFLLFFFSLISCFFFLLSNIYFHSHISLGGRTACVFCSAVNLCLQCLALIPVLCLSALHLSFLFWLRSPEVFQVTGNSFKYLYSACLSLIFFTKLYLIKLNYITGEIIKHRFLQCSLASLLV